MLLSKPFDMFFHLKSPEMRLSTWQDSQIQYDQSVLWGVNLYSGENAKLFLKSNIYHHISWIASKFKNYLDLRKGLNKNTAPEMVNFPKWPASHPNPDARACHHATLPISRKNEGHRASSLPKKTWKHLTFRHGPVRSFPTLFRNTWFSQRFTVGGSGQLDKVPLHHPPPCALHGIIGWLRLPTTRIPAVIATKLGSPSKNPPHNRLMSTPDFAKPWFIN